LWYNHTAEPDVQVIEQGSLSVLVEFDVPSRFAASLDAVRRNTIASSDLRSILAFFRRGTTIEDEQLDLTGAGYSDAVNLLIADDIGFGKTMEAGLVVQGLPLRYLVQTLLSLLMGKHGAYNVRVFGSVARGEATETSDVDFLVEQ